MVQSTSVVASQPPLTFERALYDNLHGKIITRPKLVKHQAPQSTNTIARTVPSTAQQIDAINSSEAVMNYSPSPLIDALLATPIESVVCQAATSSPLFHGTREKKHILDEYQKQYGGDSPESIITAKKGKISDLKSTCTEPTVATRKGIVRDGVRMKISRDKYYRVDDVDIYSVISTVLREHMQSFTQRDLAALACTNWDFAKFIPKVRRWLTVNFSPLLEPRLDYEAQQTIDPHRIEMVSAAMVHFGLDPGKLVQHLGREYTGQGRDVDAILQNVKSHISSDDYRHMERILREGCPAKLQFTESSDSKLKIMRRGNQKNFVENPELVKKTLNKEDRYSHILPMDKQICRFSPYLRHTSQGIV